MSDYRVAIMTGTGQGIGAGCAREMARAGYKVSLMSPSDRSVNLAKELGGIGRRGSVLDVDDLTESSHHAEIIGYIIDANRLGWSWKVRAMANDVWGPWSEERSFSVEPLNTSCL